MSTQPVAGGDLSNLTDDDLAGLYADASDHLRAAIVEVLEARDRHDAVALRKAADCSGWEEYAHAQYLAASEACGGAGLVTRDGPAGLDGIGMWRGPLAAVLPYATPELRDFWLDNPRLTPTQYAAQQASARRQEREAMMVDHCVLCGYDFGHYQLKQTCGVRTACEKRQVNPAYRARKAA